MAHRHEVSDDQWTLVEPLLSAASGQTGRPSCQPLDMLNGIFWILRTGAPWRDLPERYGPWQTVYQYFTDWRADGTFDRLLGALQNPPGSRRPHRLGSVLYRGQPCAGGSGRRRRVKKNSTETRRPRAGPLARRIRQ